MNLITLLLLNLILLSFPAFSNSTVVFEDNFDNHPDWSPTQGYGQGSGTINCNPGSCSSAPSGYIAYRIQGSEYIDKKQNTMNIDSTNYRGSSGKGFTYYNEVCDRCGWASDGLLAVKLASPTSGFSELYVRHYIKFQPSWIWNTTESPMIKMLHVFSHDGTGSVWDYFAPTPNKPLFIARPAKFTQGKDPVSHAGAIFYDGLDSEFGNGDKRSAYFPKPGGGNCDWNETGCPGDGNWHSWEYHLKMNSAPGVHDGEYDLYYDGVRIVHETNIAWHTSNGSMNRLWNYLAIGGNNYNHYALQSQEHEQWYAIDDLVISTSYIGPNYVIGGGPPADNTPPAPPTLN